MEIIATLKPLYDGMVKAGYAEFMQNNEFVRLCNELGIIELYTAANSEAQQTTEPLYSWLGGSLRQEDLLGKLLGKIYSDSSVQFLPIVISLIERFLPYAYFIPSINEIRRDLQLLGASATQLKGLDNAWEQVNGNLHKKVQVLKALTKSRAEGGGGDEEHYQAIRATLLKDPVLKKVVPEFIVKSNSVQEFWQFIKHKFSTYAERRFFIQDSFEPLLSASLERSGSVPHSDLLPEIVENIDEQYISDTWRKALGRMKDDPEAAITSARSLIELVCKYILDEKKVIYEDGTELPKLYKATATVLNLSPDQHTEQLFKQILGGCQTVVEGLGGLRNKLGDAHGMSKSKVRPSERHAALAVNLSGSMCSFLMQTYIHSQQKIG